MKVVVTGGAGFIGSAVVRLLVGELGVSVVNVDALTYAGDLETIAPVADKPGYRFVKANICDGAAMAGRAFVEIGNGRRQRGRGESC